MFQSPLASQYHFLPFKLYRTSPTTGEHECIYSEIYNSDSFIKEHDWVQRAPVPDDDWNCKQEKTVAALMFWSDATHLANFGTAKLWPIYMFLGNLSKYTCCRREIVFSWVSPDLMLVGLFQLFVGKGSPTSFAQNLLVRSEFSYTDATWFI